MDNTEFLKLNATDKIAELVERVKNTIIEGKRPSTTFYFFDENEKAHVLEIKEPFLLKEENSGILKSLIKAKLKDLSASGISVEQILFIKEGFYSKSHANKTSMDLDKDFNQNNANEALIVSVEDMFDFKLKIYDVIKITDAGETFTVLSKDPIEDLSLCKMDPDINVKTLFSNFL